MIPFEELVLALERYKQRKQAGAPATPAGQAVSGKQGQPAKQVPLSDLHADDLQARR